MGELQKIPGVGKQPEQDLLLLGFLIIASLKNAGPQNMYDRACVLRGQKIDRCQLYVIAARFIMPAMRITTRKNSNGGAGKN